MAKLHSLIKFKRHELDDKRQLLAKLNDALDRLRGQKQQLLDDLAHEKNLAAVDIDTARGFAPFLKKTLARITELDEFIREKQREIQAATHVVQEAYLEVKKLEITQERSDDTEESRLKRIEANNLDEMGIESFRRGQEEGRV